MELEELDGLDDDKDMNEEEILHHSRHSMASRDLCGWARTRKLFVV